MKGSVKLLLAIVLSILVINAPDIIEWIKQEVEIYHLYLVMGLYQVIAALIVLDDDDPPKWILYTSTLTLVAVIVYGIVMSIVYIVEQANKHL